MFSFQVDLTVKADGESVTVHGSSLKATENFDDLAEHVKEIVLRALLRFRRSERPKIEAPPSKPAVEAPKKPPQKLGHPKRHWSK